MSISSEWSQLWRYPALDVTLLHASYIRHAFARHQHDYYVLAVVERGLQTFLHNGVKLVTPPGGVMLINPGAVHTGEPADERGYQMRCIYPSVRRMQAVVSELSSGRDQLPEFREARVDQRWAGDSIVRLHKALTSEGDALERESLYTWTLAELVKRFADLSLNERRVGNERETIRRACRYLTEHYAERVSLDQLAAHVALSPYYFLRAFAAEMGMPPFAYLESVRIREAQRLIEAGRPLVDVAVETGFSSQSHLTNRFKRIIGVTPGQYARQHA